MKNLKVFYKLAIGFGVVIVLTLALAVLAILSSMTTDRDYTHLLEYPQQRIITMLRINNKFLSARRALYHMCAYTGLSGAESNIQALSVYIEQSFRDIDEGLEIYAGLIRSDPEFTDDEKSFRAEAVANIRDLSEQWHNEVVIPVTQANLEGRRQDVVDIATAGATIADGLFNSVDEMINLAVNTTDTISRAVSTSADRSMLLLVVISVFIIAISVGFAVVIPMGIVKPLAPLSAFMQKAGMTGDFIISPEESKIIRKYSGHKDEIGQCIAGAMAFVRHVADVAGELEIVASGDLTVEVELLSAADAMGKSLKLMVDNLNAMFGEIHGSSTQVSTGAKQVAQGAQSMAQGATEQAASMQEFSSSIAVLTEKTRENADIADKSAKLADEIIQNAENGSRQMDEMISAVQEISHASQNISKIIKVIDDIAFQTNILALNAAVEAARAGEYGRGFAVVAEEVRSLASKSAEAAKETGTMIENAKSKAELGDKIANETAASLAEIVSGITESSSLIREIARASEEQTLGIGQINIGIDQVAQVVQQNAATAEESAAASEEMDAQSTLLQELVSRFTLKGTGKSGMKQLPAEEAPPVEARRGAALAGSRRAFIPDHVGGDKYGMV
ncbi:MAG: methyl-accepting chemotaxis protein [Clostridiales bacterium]|nr:methyl-accepting chemotaxis protein [Clostridiales bacterium]